MCSFPTALTFPRFPKWLRFTKSGLGLILINLTPKDRKLPSMYWIMSPMDLWTDSKIDLTFYYWPNAIVSAWVTIIGLFAFFASRRAKPLCQIKLQKFIILSFQKLKIFFAIWFLEHFLKTIQCHDLSHVSCRRSRIKGIALLKQMIYHHSGLCIALYHLRKFEQCLSSSVKIPLYLHEMSQDFVFMERREEGIERMVRRRMLCFMGLVSPCFAFDPSFTTGVYWVVVRAVDVIRSTSTTWICFV